MAPDWDLAPDIDQIIDAALACEETISDEAYIAFVAEFNRHSPTGYNPARWNDVDRSRRKFLSENLAGYGRFLRELGAASRAPEERLGREVHHRNQPGEGGHAPSPTPLKEVSGE